MIPSIASRLDILADIADQMEQNEENRNNIQIFKYLIESIQKQQQQTKPIDFSMKINEPSSLHPFSSYLSSDNLLNSNKDFLKEFSKRIQQAQEHLINVNEQDSIDSSVSIKCIPLKKRYKSNISSSPSDINQDDVYYERRRKNNEAAKRSRDVRRVKEDEIALRAAFLEQENVKLRLENTHLKQENVQLHYQIYSSTKS